MKKRSSGPEKSESSQGSKPLHRVQFGNISGAVFANTHERKDGQEFQDYSISLQRSYRDPEGEWQRSSISFYRREILAAIEALTECYKATYSQSSQPTDEEDFS